eukprot:429373_1
MNSWKTNEITEGYYQNMIDYITMQLTICIMKKISETITDIFGTKIEKYVTKLVKQTLKSQYKMVNKISNEKNLNYLIQLMMYEGKQKDYLDRCFSEVRMKWQISCKQCIEK